MRYEWRSLLLVPSRSAADELFKYKMTLMDVRGILNDGRPCENSKRKTGTHEICVDKKGKTVRVVVKKVFSAFERSDVWLIVHVGIHSKIRY